MTTVVATVFMLTSLALSYSATHKASSVIEKAPQAQQQTAPAEKAPLPPEQNAPAGQQK
jgi:preprotein translocase subunit SecG